MIKNKKGFAWIPIILVGTLISSIVFPSFLSFLTGGKAGSKISEMVASLPAWFWILLIFILFITLSKRGKQ